MKDASKYFIPAALAIMTLVGCVNEESGPEVTGSKDCPDFTATISAVGTRAFDRSWEQGDRIGISGCGRTNVCHHTSAGDGNFTVTKTGSQIYFQSDAETDFTAYYPWNDLAEGVAINADTRSQTEQKNFDFLWSKASGKKDAPNVAFTFAHRMAKVVLTIHPGSGMSYEEVKRARLSLGGFRHTGAFNPADGSTTVTGVAEPWDFSDFAQFNDTEKTLTFSLLLFPQRHNEPLEFLAGLEMPGNQSLSLKAAIDFTNANRGKDGSDAKNEWVAGRQYNLSLTLNKTEISVGECVINPWTEIKGDDITVD